MVILAVDPGETSGISIFSWPHDRQIKPREDMTPYLVHIDQIKTTDLVEKVKRIAELINTYHPQVLVYEKFLLYGHKAQAQIGSDMYTPQVIGQLKIFVAIYNLQEISNTAQNAKLFYTDKKLKEHNMWQTGMKHCRDSIRHAMYAIDFNLCKPKKK